ncbi:Ankyrin repeat and zinc finger domain-containing protein 1 [Sesamum alatum]|uniref:Ankyrin repeat and zinc finger domain-containing protein 1 n=1 Tax=Sesamum alatum TaxID=300844 RepID=A0AAE2CE27_9LAMI|nr:Ankyrin repeat and zinc finger domain-containing protein 1 [Sesamum alatum]
MATEATTAAAMATKDRPTKPQPRKQYKQEDTKRQRSVFEVPSDFFDSCRLLDSPLSSLPDTDAHQENALRQSNAEKEIIEDSNNDSNSNGAKAMQRWSCNTCKAEFESLQDQRFHFKSDLHRFNIKLSIAGKNIIKEEDFDEATSDSLYKDYDVSSISGSEDEDERETSLPPDRQRESGGVSKSKIFVQLQNGERVSVWRCLLLDESEHVSFETDKLLVVDGAGDTYLTQREVIEKLKYILHEPRDNTHLRIVLLARGGHFAGCVFDGNSLVAHKTFHRYVVRAKAGKKQSSKDAGGRAIHSAGASLRRYNEFALKKDIQELLTLWKPYFAVASCVFIYAPSNNRQLFFDGDKPYFICQGHTIRNIPLTVRRPTFKEASRIYSLLVQISYEVSGEIALNTKEEPLSHANAGSESRSESSEMELRENVEGTKTTEACSIVTEIADLSLSAECKEQIDTVGTSTPLHEAAKSGNAQMVLELLEQGLDPCIRDERGQTPYMVANEKEVRNTFRRFMASNLEKWDWHAAKVPSALTKEMEETQAAKQAEKDAKRKARAKELKKLRKAKEKKAQAEAANAGSGTAPTTKVHSQSSSSMRVSKEEELKRIQDAEREKRAAAAERRIAALKASQETASLSNTQLNNTSGSDILCSCCNVSLAGKVPFHRYHYKYCSTSCMHVHREFLEEEDG